MRLFLGTLLVEKSLVSFHRMAEVERLVCIEKDSDFGTLEGGAARIKTTESHSSRKFR